MKHSYRNVYPIGIQNFAKLRENGYIYVDKTAILYPLVEKGGYFFLSRPRRFGKSLLISTIEAYYEGRRDLFRGLAIDSLTEDWQPHPIMHLDLNTGDYRSAESLLEVLDKTVSGWERTYGCENHDWSIALRFGEVIEQAYRKTGKEVVVLIDEYDKPLLSAVEDQVLAEEFRSILKAFYSNLKTKDRYIKLAMITGVARFSKVSIFSDLNNLRDISFSEQFAAICGITAEEIRDCFDEGIQNLSEKFGIPRQVVMDELRKNYDGYHFARKSPDIYNPFSLLNVFADENFRSYWFDTGTPTYLVKIIEKAGLPVAELSGYEIKENRLETTGILSGDPVPAFFQSGYLTIKSYDPVFKTYTLDYPNQEVKEGFIDFLVPYYLAKTTGTGGHFNVKKFVNAVVQGDAEGFMVLLDSLIANVPYSEKGTGEDHFRTAIYMLFTLMGYHTHMEDRMSTGRMDLTVETDDYVYLFEFKINKSAEAAIEQIRQREYWRKFMASGKVIFLIGANFDTRTRKIDNQMIEVV